MNNLKIYSKKEIEESVKKASPFVIVKRLFEVSKNEIYNLLLKGITLGGEVVDAIIKQQRKTKNITHFNNNDKTPTL